jgi:hypothetical protein
VPSNRSKPGAIHLSIVEVLKRFPEGVTGGQIRQELEKQGLKPEAQTHLDRRKRDLKKWFAIEKIKVVQQVGETRRIVTLYKYVGDRTEIVDQGQVDEKTRAEIIRAAHGRCHRRFDKLTRRVGHDTLSKPFDLPLVVRRMSEAPQQRLNFRLCKDLAVGV